MDEKFLAFLRERGIAEPAEKDLLSQFLKREVPEFSALPAVRELRDQFRCPRVELKVRYPGRRSGVDPIAFLLEHYGDEIERGELGTGRLGIIDPNLGAATRSRLAEIKPQLSLDEFFRKHRAEGKEAPRYERRVRACAELLGSSDLVSASRFFSSLGATSAAKINHAERARRGDIPKSSDVITAR